MLTKTDNRGILTTYKYDCLNRLYSKTYSDGTPAVTYTYDPTGSYGVGHLGSVSNANSTTNYLTFDQLGRVTSSNQMNGAKTYPFYYGYNFASDLTSEQYPSGRVVSFTYDNANRLNGASGQMGAQASAYASSFVYAAFGQPTNYQYGNGVVRVLNYNSRLQIQSYTDQGYNSTTNTTTPLLSATLNWYDANNHNNGNLQGVTYTHSGSGFSTPATFSDTFTYDNVNRLLSATDVLVATGATEWLQNYGFDQYGNMSVLSSTGITPPGNTPGPYTSFSNNQIVGGRYDLAGNQTLVNGNTLTYDAEGREVKNISNGTETYAYDGNSKRVGKSGPTSVTTFVYDALGQLAMEVSSVATVPACVTCYLTDDHLGSTRLVTDGSGNVVARHDYLPFGYEIQASDNVGRGIQFGGYDNVNQKFTAKERDAESGLDYFGARYYGSALGRFTSPDWSAKPQAVPYVDLKNAQSLNLYNYMRNNPLGGVDPDGHDAQQTLTDDQVRSVSSDIKAIQKFANDHPILTNIIINGAMMILSRGEAGSGARVEPSEVNAGTASGLTPGKEVSPSVNPSEVIGKTPAEIDQLATGKGLIPKGTDPMNGKGAYVDPVTGQQRVLSHPEAETPHAHVNNPSGERLGPDGTVVAPESPAAHLPIKRPQP